jgi:hypothetical protein
MSTKTEYFEFLQSAPDMRSWANFLNIRNATEEFWFNYAKENLIKLLKFYLRGNATLENLLTYS